MMINRIIEEIKKAKRIAILPHVSADGDSIGSSIALSLAINKSGKESKIFTEEEIAQNYSFLEGAKDIEVYIKKPAQNYDLVITIDCGDIERLGSRCEIFKNTNNTVNIDHHPTNTEFAFINYVQTNAAAAGEIIYQIIKLMGIEFDKDISESLYVAIASDTGGFRFSNTTSVTHQIASDLLNNGINVADISHTIFDTITLEKAKLIAVAINSIEIFKKGKVAFITINKDVFESTGALDEDTEGIVNIGRNIDGVEVSVLFRQLNNNETKLNMRSKSYLDVSVIASLYKGGGHKRAAGATVTKPIDELKKMVLKDIEEML
ncbi:MAG: bifunctional oligoribonuclease/PAP phosphatase NrnA [Clostridia bacterium]